MTWQQELDDMVYEERERANAEKRRADKAESRAEMYEKMLKEHGLL